MRVLITRPQADSLALSAELAQRGHEVISEPLLRIDIIEGPNIPSSGLQAIVLTSANGARAAAHRIRNRDVLVFAVGSTTATEAGRLGFRNLSISAGNGVSGLVSHIRSQASPEVGDLLHVTSAHTAGDLAGRLASLGYRIRTAEAYASTAVTQMSQHTVENLSAGRIDAAMFFSPRTAETFSALIEAGGLAAHCARITALALSQNVAGSLQLLMFRKVLVAETTGTVAMLDLLRAV